MWWRGGEKVDIGGGVAGVCVNRGHDAHVNSCCFRLRSTKRTNTPLWEVSHAYVLLLSLTTEGGP